MIDQFRPRRTFAIISHPDAGKTTLTEKLLLYGGAIHTAGTVKANRAARYATSDWMALERQRGISITSSVLQFPYRDFELNLLDTPGHQDFSEDTYRTLAAVDSAVMLIDSVKGVEAQTKKLFAVCRMRGIPIFTFINKLDRNGKEPLELMAEIEAVLNVRTCPMNWPIGMGPTFKGILDRATGSIFLFEGSQHGAKEGHFRRLPLDDSRVGEVLGSQAWSQLRGDLELLDAAGDPLDLDRVTQGVLSPLYFGSAMTNFGIQLFLESFIDLAPAPGSKMTTEGLRHPDDPQFCGFIFKIQANMNPAHRDCIAFLRVVSGKFTRGMNALHPRSGRILRLSKSMQFMAQDRHMVEDAFPGDVVGLFDPGLFRIGDALCEGKRVEFPGIPSFTPELFAAVSLRDPSKRKQFKRALDQLINEGTIQLFFKPSIGEQEAIIGAIGQLQFEVFGYRLKFEYGVDVDLKPLSFSIARWVVGDRPDPKEIGRHGDAMLLQDRDGRSLVLASSQYTMRWLVDKHPHLQFSENLEEAISAPKSP